MRRRDFLATAASGALAGLAGCASLFETRSALAPPLVENRPDAVYVPTHVEGMQVAGTNSQGDLRCALTYSYPHRFWLVKPDGVTEVDIEGEDTMHLMPVVWDARTDRVLADVSPQVEIRRDGSLVASVSPWAMLSQPMGLHAGTNVAVQGDGTYGVDVRVGSPSTRRLGFEAPTPSKATFSFDFDFSQSTLDETSYRDIPADEQGQTGAVSPMSMDALPTSTAPTADSLPGTVRGTAGSGDARLAVTSFDDAERFGGGADQAYLAVSARTPYNRYALAQMALSATLERDGETVYDDVLEPAVSTDLYYHYGATVPGVESGDDLTLTVDAPPQLARHEGYETAFLDMPAASLTLD